MGNLFSPKFSILSDWRTTVGLGFQTLRRIKFVIEDTFSFGDFDPQISFGGLTTVSYVIGRARYLKIFKMLWISFDVRFTATVAASSNSVSIIAPGNIASGEGTSRQGGACFIVLETIPFSYEVASWYHDTDSPVFNKIVVRRNNAGTAFTTDATRLSLNCFVELK